MRRTQAGQIQPITSLAETACRQCGATGVTVLGYGRNENGALEAAWCGIPCARKDGWPWLKAERSPRTQDLFEGLPIPHPARVFPAAADSPHGSSNLPEGLFIAQQSAAGGNGTRINAKSGE